MFLLLLSLSLSLSSAHSPLGSSCGTDDSCRRPPDLPPSERAGETSELRALTALLCRLDCLEQGEDEGDALIMCSEICSTTIQAPLSIISSPVSEPFLEERNQDGLYAITIPDATESELMSSGSESLLIGSGETGSENAGTGSGRVLEAYIVRVSQYGNNTYFPVTSQVSELDLSQFACSEVNVSYAVVEAGGAVSGYSPPLTTCILTPQVVVAGAARNLAVAFEETFGAPMQARVFLSWDPSSEVRGPTSYELIVNRTVSTDTSTTPEDEACEKQPPLTYDIDGGQTNFTIEPTGDNLTSVLFSCTYNIELISLPGNESISEVIRIAYSGMGDRSFKPVCNGTYLPGSISYNLSVSWAIQDPLILEAISDFQLTFHSINGVLGITEDIRNHRREEFIFHLERPVVARNQQYTISVKPNGPRKNRRNDPFHWRRPLIPGKRNCTFPTPAHRPTPVPAQNISLQLEPMSSGILSFSLTWAPPTFLNGRLERYDVCIGEEAVEGTGRCSEPSECFFLHATEASPAGNLVGCIQLGVVGPQQELSAKIDYHVVAGTKLLYLQIRAVNNFSLRGEWSDAQLILNATSLGGPGRSGSSLSGMVWIYMTAVMLLVVLVALVVVVALCVYRHFCFHRRIKYEDSMVMQHLRADYIPPSFIPVADEWEVPAEDVEIHYSEELGHGAFGRVYRGLFHSRELREMMNGGGRRGSRKRGSFGRRRPSRKNTVQSIGSCVVAIKRLRDNIDGPDKANFLKEIEMMKRVSGASHDHQKFVVNMLGCVTIQEPMMLVLEYAPHGDLLTYLRNSREEDDGGAANLKAAPYLEPKGAYSKLPPREGAQEGGEEEEYRLTEKDLLSFARQMAAGMEFLSSLNMVHRDLACRNILVCENSLMKISDFGLSRSLVNQEAYVTTTKGVLPIRWMAPEALFYRTFDTQSDVWSFGILLWELYTLGGYPYPTMSNRDIIDLLTHGYRMDKPELCSDQMYNVMLQCWSNLGLERPTFSELYVTFDRMLGESTRHQSPYVQVLGVCYYDKLGPRVDVDSETLDLENAPAGVDIRQPSTATAASEGVFGTSLPETGNGFLSIPAQGHQSRSPSQDYPSRQLLQDHERPLRAPPHLARPRSWVGTSSADLGPRYVPAPLVLGGSPHSSASNLTQETTFRSSVATLSSQGRLSVSHSRSVGSIPLLTGNSSTLRSHTTATTRL